jgi:DNA repair exonuclease SbcCD ATPase subunit
MFLPPPVLRFFLSLALAFIFAGCTLKYTPPTPEDYAQETARLEKRLQKQGDASVRAKSHLQLAWLYSSYKNPKMDYGKALIEFEAYLSLVPDEAGDDEIQNWLSILRQLERSEKESTKMTERIEVLSRENQENIKLRSNIELLTKENAEKREALEQQAKKNQKLQENIEKLQESNNSLKQAIENLKTLDLQIERKRRSIK